MTSYRRWAGIAALATAVTTLAACSSSSSSSAASPAASTSSSANAATSAGGTAATGTPLVLYTLSSINTPGGSFPGQIAAINAAIRDINAHGGIKGHPLELQSCNTEEAPNQEVTCARNAAASKAVALIAPMTLTNVAGDLQAFQGAGLADVADGAVSPLVLSSPVAFPLDAGSFSADGCLQLVKSGTVTKMATVASDIAAVEANVNLVKQAATPLGISITTNVTLPTTAPDVTSQVQQVVNSGANGMLLFAVPNQAGQVIEASAQLGQKMAFCTIDGLITGGQLATLGAAAGNVYASSSMPPLSAASSNPAIAHFISDMKAEQAAGDSAASLGPATYLSSSLRAWTGVQVFAQVARSISGPVTRASFLAAIRTATNINTGIFPPINFTKPVGGKAFPSLYNGVLHLLKWDAATKQFTATNMTFNVASTFGP